LGIARVNSLRPGVPNELGREFESLGRATYAGARYHALQLGGLSIPALLPAI